MSKEDINNYTANQIISHEPTRTEEKKDILLKDECYKINSCIYEVNKKLGSGITNQHKAQLINYLAATNFRVGLLVNFSSCPKAEIIRMVR